MLKGRGTKVALDDGDRGPCRIVGTLDETHDDREGRHAEHHQERQRLGADQCILHHGRQSNADDVDDRDDEERRQSESLDAQVRVDGCILQVEREDHGAKVSSEHETDDAVGAGLDDEEVDPREGERHRLAEVALVVLVRSACRELCIAS